MFDTPGLQPTMLKLTSSFPNGVPDRNEPTHCANILPPFAMVTPDFNLEVTPKVKLLDQHAEFNNHLIGSNDDLSATKSVVCANTGKHVIFS